MDVLDPFPYIDKRNTTLYVHVLSMKEGDSILIMIPDGSGTEIIYKNILIDLGIAELIEIKDYLHHFHALHLDALIITHPHNDHAYNINKFCNDPKLKIDDIWLTEYFSTSKEKRERSPKSYQEFIKKFSTNDEKLKIDVSSKFNFVRFYSITEDQAIQNCLRKENGRDYYTEDIKIPIRRI